MPDDHHRVAVKDLPPEFFLPPADNADLWRETRTLLLLSFGFIFALAVVVTLTQGIVIKL
ncbi:hypothetical protein [Mycobacterium sp. E1747]|uniref:DUF7156 family protein n=1 Tax=Mycobacterium sp. E1747 TaxID=1834128 RepID=UPI0008002286|nr:hypothetical protein [Mycobacterium sp. E1747]OBH06921.1 hypothetical protein A5695_04025 [Mycobacterium sp. E1747]